MPQEYPQAWELLKALAVPGVRRVPAAPRRPPPPLALRTPGFAALEESPPVSARFGL